MARRWLTAGASKQQAKFVEGIFSKDLIVAGITSNSKVDNSINQVMLVIVMLSVAMAPEANEVIDTMQDNSKKNSVGNRVVAIGETKKVKAIKRNSGK